MEKYNLTHQDHFKEVTILEKDLVIIITTNQKPTIKFMINTLEELKKLSKIKGLEDDFEIEIIKI